ncbi:Hydantoinase/oxoprolinase [Sporothrix schenckii 1099-18]|uniref:Hydantoinase/oxoprolinase n=2 Tax=Sporothrix schenckii TaxID=29908 RepID=U7Q3K9_SPOS1|nr:Hydantoinase/oxoprolinase [Sporothrix schenckii 1099-18]ERT01311.1 hypothetical protein HMPREF1624_02554 [Sporothrix schenckii ATCC 58251]KJR88483.1 Hydantoinase/oxoprolinase [Sporothrix schenckii 1099-18]
MGSTERRRLRIGVDVGGTNTDGVVLDPARSGEPDKGIVAWHKAATTTNPSVGIGHAITEMLTSAHIPAADVASVTIGTTHFVNAVVERDARRLSPVAVLRLCGPFSHHTPPCVDWPADMRALVLKHYAILPGGLEVDGSLIADIDAAAIEAACIEIKDKHKEVKSIVVSGTFSPIDTVERQEERAAAIVRRVLPGHDVVLSKDVASLGFVERENAAILNAAILAFARRTIRAFHEPVQRLGLQCPVFITQNDGTVLSGAMAAKLPIRTFSSGPTNSMRGAAFLVDGETDLKAEAVMVVDIGGTTTDVGLLLASGFPRQQAAYSELAGVRMNFSCPDIKSIGIGGGSIVRRLANAGDSPSLTVGPDSVGYKLTSEAVVFGGDVLTTTDCTVMADPANVQIGNAGLVKGRLTADELAAFQQVVKKKIERVIDNMKTSPQDVPVLLVGGGAVIAPDTLKGASRVLKPRWSGVANAIGAAMARVSAVVDTVKSTEGTTTAALLRQISEEAIAQTVAAGADPATVKIAEMDTLPLQYVQNKSRFVVRAAGDFDYSRTDMDQPSKDAVVDAEEGAEQDMEQYEKTAKDASTTASDAPSSEPVTKPAPSSDLDIDTYRPLVRGRNWFVSETDVNWIASGCYVLGTGGGGSPYSHMVRLREMLRKGAVVRVVSPDDLADDAQVGTGGSMGSPTVGIEKLPGDEMLEAQRELARVCAVAPTHIISIEIGGGNGLQSMVVGASTNMDLPAVDGDWMGRAYPTKWQTTPVVFNERAPVFAPMAMCDGNGNTLVVRRAVSDAHVERITRAAVSQMGSHAGCAEAPVRGDETRRWAVAHTISQAWRIGRAIDRARRTSNLDRVADAIIDACGGAQAAKVLWRGKIVGVERTLRMGHVYGECIIEGGSEDGVETASGSFVGRVKIPFKNENIAVLRVQDGADAATEKQEDVVALVPDLIAVIDDQNGEAIGTPEYRYGLFVTVLGIAASDRWTHSERAVSIGGPEAFGFGHLKYEPLGTFVKPRSVIDEFDTAV